MPSHFILSLFEFLECFSPLSFHGPAWYLVRIRPLLNLFHETEILIHGSSYSFISMINDAFPKPRVLDVFYLQKNTVKLN